MACLGGESKHRLASDSSLSCMGMAAGRSSQRLNSCHSFTATPSPNGTPREDTGTKGF